MLLSAGIVSVPPKLGKALEHAHVTSTAPAVGLAMVIRLGINATAPVGKAIVQALVPSVVHVAYCPAAAEISSADENEPE
jgi:hypothetical protein